METGTLSYNKPEQRPYTYEIADYGLGFEGISEKRLFANAQI